MTESIENPVLVSRRGPVGVLTISREDRRNALSRQTLVDLGRLTQQLVDDPEIRAIVVTGSGNRVFCAGADLKERQGMTNEDVRVQVGLYRSELGALDKSPKPVVAAMNGSAFGGGLELALICDLRVAAPHAMLGLPETTLGIIPGAGGTQRLPRIVGEARAKELILLGRPIDAQTALAWGLVNHVAHTDENIVDATVAWLDPIARGAPIAQAAALAAIDDSFDTTLSQGLMLERVHYDETLRSEDRSEALRAFAEKRSPVFRGR